MFHIVFGTCKASNKGQKGPCCKLNYWHFALDYLHHSFHHVGNYVLNVLREELATAILNKKAKPNRLLVEDAVNDDNSVVALSLAKVSPSHGFMAHGMRCFDAMHGETQRFALCNYFSLSWILALC